ncbi:MAG: hypothetical protein ACXVXP_00055 [Mycobacteriaceae bacterium]
MTTLVTGSLRRSVSDDTFADLPGMAGVEVTAITAAGVEFSSNLTPAQIAAVRDRMASTCDADQAARAHLATLRAAVTGTDSTSLLLVALADYVLGD